MIQLQRDSLSHMLRLTGKTLVLSALLAAAALAGGCASAPSAPRATAPARIAVEPRVADAQVGGAIADVAMGMVGTRYRYGGTDPKEGFDCSGLVHYAYGQAGYAVPRTSQELFRAARKIAVGDADPGDLMFFQDQTKLSHVGIYLGDGLFVHAPASGANVAVASLDSPYYRQHLVAVGRLLPH
jgi:cell wall-associated NlpC family hydrolase